ncbi:hypothetical protein OG455_02450 [Kitasatospora sp. NBC_01287]|uniref:hypothetical protein n=1 Tax=Kitasatospora sp. NBC_01287 TaxID=2903573 RepID=UPI002257B038|nr:hypothetical protein [Kitasatospora sp. NBC_01287]MCX4744386.1 hypothetical protein [Kitasatospora sp. NBC_01287]
MSDDRFLTLSAELTGFAVDELRATGLAATYRAVLLEHAGPEALARLTALGGAPPPADEPLRALARDLVQLWYCGTRPGARPEVVSAQAYANGLVWRAFGGRAPGTTAAGHGSWSTAPANR